MMNQNAAMTPDLVLIASGFSGAGARGALARSPAPLFVVAPPPADWEESAAAIAEEGPFEDSSFLPLMIIYTMSWRVARVKLKKNFIRMSGCFGWAGEWVLTKVSLTQPYAYPLTSTICTTSTVNCWNSRIIGLF